MVEDCVQDAAGANFEWAASFVTKKSGNVVIAEATTSQDIFAKAFRRRPLTLKVFEGGLVQELLMKSSASIALKQEILHLFCVKYLNVGKSFFS